MGSQTIQYSFKVCNHNSYNNKCVTFFTCTSVEYICHRTVAKGKMLAMAVTNKLELKEIPVELQGLYTLERHLIAK